MAISDLDFYTLSPSGRTRRLRRLAEAALAHYDLGVNRIVPLSMETNAVFRIDAGDRFVLRIGRGGGIGHTTEQVEAEVAYLTYLTGLGLRVPEPVVSRAGDGVVRVSVPVSPTCETSSNSDTCPVESSATD